MSRGSWLPQSFIVRIALTAVVAGCSAGESCVAGCEMHRFTISGGEDAAVYTTSAPVPVGKQEQAPVDPSVEARREEGSYSTYAGHQPLPERGAGGANEANAGREPGYTVVRRYSEATPSATLAAADASPTTATAAAGDGAVAPSNDADQVASAAHEEAEVPAGPPPEPINVVVVTSDVPPVPAPRTNVSSPTPRSVNYPLPPVPPVPGSRPF